MGEISGGNRSFRIHKLGSRQHPPHSSAVPTTADMACISPATASGKHRAGATASATEEAKVEWWLRFNNGVPAADDGDAADSGDEVEEEAAAGAGGKGVSCGRAERSVAADEEVGMGSCSRRVAMGAKAGMVARGGGKAEAAAAGSGCNRQRSSPRFADRAELDGKRET